MDIDQAKAILLEADKSRRAVSCRIEAAYKLFEAACIISDNEEAEVQRRNLHALQDLLLDSMASVGYVMSKMHGT